jgi:two-component system, OmpR family, alkaline phosphatase synthesis response regulator PhoP
MKRILVVEDERDIALALQNDLAAEGYAVELTGDGQTALECARDGHFDLILLDIMLPGIDGYTVCAELRRLGDRTPILMLTSKGTEADKRRGLSLGADDYVAKPFGAEELRARVRELLRRTAGEAAEIYRFGDVEVNLTSSEVLRKNRLIEVTPLELKLLFVFVRRRGQILTREQLLNEVQGSSIGVVDRAIDNHIMNLRRKIEPDPVHPTHLVSVRGLGYRFDG